MSGRQLSVTLMESRSLEELWNFEDRYSALAGSPIGKVRSSAEESLQHRARGLFDRLTPRELEVLRLVVVGLLNKQIAGALKTSEKTIQIHRSRVMQKLGLTSVPDLMRLSQTVDVLPARFDIESRSTVQSEGKD